MLPSLNVPHLPEVAQAAEGLFIQLVFHNLPLQINPWCSSQQCTESWLATEGRELQTSDFSFFVCPELHGMELLNCQTIDWSTWLSIRLVLIRFRCPNPRLFQCPPGHGRDRTGSIFLQVSKSRAPKRTPQKRKSRSFRVLGFLDTWQQLKNFWSHETSMVLSLPHDALQFPPKKTSRLAAFSPVQRLRRQQKIGGFFWALPWWRDRPCPPAVPTSKWGW